MKFGYLPIMKNIDSNSFKCSTLPNLSTYEEIVKNWHYIDGNWAYPPWESDPRFDNKIPLKPVTVFGFNPSHIIESKIDNVSVENIEKYLVLIIGFLNGLHLLPENWIHFRRTAIKPGTLVGFIISPQDEKEIIELALAKYNSYSERYKKAMYGIIHWFLASQEYTTQFDRFNNQYIVTDSIYRFCYDNDPDKKKGKQGHNERIKYLCEKLDIELPDWAKVTGKESYISKLRNNLIHEAMFNGEPIGFKQTEININLCLTNLNELFILRLLGLDSNIAEYPNRVVGMTYLVKLKK